MMAIITKRRRRDLSVHSHFRMPIGYEQEFSKMTDGIRIKHLSKKSYDDTRRHIAETCGPGQNQSVRT